MSKKLYLEDGKEAGVFYCPECRIVSKDEKIATECCKKYHCEDCKEEVPKYFLVCSECSKSRKISKAIEAPDDGGPVYDEAKDKYHDEMDWLLDDYACDEETPPEFVFPCKVIPFKLRPDSILENATEDMFEDAYDHLTDVKGFTEFVEQWAKKQTLSSWYPDYSRKIRVPVTPAPAPKASP